MRCLTILSILLVSACGIVSGCGTATIEDAVPAAAGQSGAAAPAWAPSGDYPNLNVAPQVAAEQFTEAEKQAQAARLRAVRAQVEAQASGQAVPDRRQELHQLGETHADKAERIIEGR